MPFHVLPALAAIGVLLFVAVRDYRTLTVTNGSVGLLVLLYLLFAALSGFGSWMTDLAGAALLFILALGMWLMRLLGAGDAKLLVPLGLFMGLDGLAPFSFFLLAVSLLALVVLKVMARVNDRGKMAEINRSGKFPYATLLVTAAVPVIFVRAIWFP